MLYRSQIQTFSHKFKFAPQHVYEVTKDTVGACSQTTKRCTQSLESQNKTLTNNS